MTSPRGTPRPPPADLARRTLDDLLVPVIDVYWRISHEKAPLVDWSDNAESRFSHPALPYPVLYLAKEKETCFWERFGEEIRDQPLDGRGLSSKIIGERVWKKVTVGNQTTAADGSIVLAAAQCLDLRNVETLRRLGADGATFFATYEITQAWAGALMSHPAGIEGLLYTSRLDTPETCLALFKRASIDMAPALITAAIDPVRPILDPELLEVFTRERIALLAPAP